MEKKRLPASKPVQDINESLGKLPPQALDLEESVLGAIMLEKNAIIEVAGFLRPEHFYSTVHEEIYRSIQRLFSAGDVIDMRTVIFELRKSGHIETIGGATAIARIVSSVSSSANIESHARKLVEMAMKRSLILLANGIHQEAYDDSIDVFSQIEKSNLLLQEVLDNAISAKSEKNMVQITADLVKQVEARISGKHMGLDSGYAALDAVTNGWQPTDLIIEAARPGMGKSAHANQGAKQIAERGIPVGLISLEMSSIQIVERLAIAECEIDSDKVKKGKMSELEISLFLNACGNLSKLPLHIDDTPFMTIMELRARAMKMKAKHGIQLLVIDYLQLIRGSGKPGQNRDQEIGEITRTLKGVAKELEIPVIALSQLSRGLETRGGSKRPQLSDLRESGNIEQDADIVIFLYRPEYYKITEDEDGTPTHGLCEVIIAKHRNGSLDTVRQKFVGKFTKFMDWEFTQRQDQGTYVSQHYKNPLPSERTPDELKSDDLPF